MTGHFTSDQHALVTGLVAGAILGQVGTIISDAVPVVDPQSNYKPYVTVRTHDGRTFRVIVTEIEPVSD